MDLLKQVCHFRGHIQKILCILRGLFGPDMFKGFFRLICDLDRLRIRAGFLESGSPYHQTILWNAGGNLKGKV